eukprot:TRINITY_DN1761_c0_g1_i2.p1 TRINITY_DN1761_c0_g1~~TRINITY_DN1761_c0_g1_i2.p1  ORF type:complete len:114 (-),score=9.78 TRINITY_DN1761_c0_g1_i2:368-709(-)
MFGLVCGLIRYILNKPEFSVALLGLDNAGKTTLSERIHSMYAKKDMPEKITPTIGLNVRRVEMDEAKLRLWDLSGELGMRKIWPNYYEEADGIIYCIDCSDSHRLEESKLAFG